MQNTAFVTGGGSGIGEAVARALAAQGWLVTVAGRSKTKLQAVVSAIEATGGSARVAECDVSDEASVRAAVGVAIAGTNRLDAAVNSAGVSGGDALKPLAEYSTEQFDTMIATDLRGTFLSMKYELQHMTRGSSIVNLGSGASLVGVPGFAGYVAAKHGVAGLTKAGALDYGAAGIRINCIAAGLVETPLVATGRSPEVMAARIAAHPIGRIARASEIADTVLWLLSDQSSFVTGAVIPVDGGYTAR